MKIKNISCTQFAGIRNKSYSFDNGLNLVYGKNESGKSTLVHLLSRTLFNKVRIGDKDISDKDFKKLYFPGIKRNSSVKGDFADGIITFDTERGTYTLKKEWGIGSGCTLSTPDGEIRDPQTIDAILKETLIYGEGVYSDMLFSSQRNTDISLQTILDASKKTDAKQEITDAVSMAFAESDGITADALEQAIQEKIEEIAGKHWDTERGLPKRNPKGRWSYGLGEILKAYYELEDAKAVLETITCLEKEADTASADYTKKDEEAETAESDYERFRTYAGQLTVQSERRKTIERLEKEAAKIKEILSVWPELIVALKKATILKIEKEHRELLDKYESAKELNDEIVALRKELDGQICPKDIEIEDVKNAQKKIATLENKLCGMNLNVVIKMFGDNAVNITSLRTGQALDTTKELLPITEAVSITVPGVMEMQLGPADANVLEIETSITEQKKIISNIFSHYNVEDISALERLAKTISDRKAKIERLSAQLSLVLGTTDYEQLETQVKKIDGEVREKEVIDQDIYIVCGTNDMNRYIVAKETTIQGYENDYESVDLLKAKAYDVEMELLRARASINTMENIPLEYKNISDPEDYLSKLQNNLKFKQNVREDALTKKTTVIGKLESYKENLSSDPVYDVENAERIFLEQEELLGHWMHIAEVLELQKQNIQNNPMKDIAQSFSRYLAIISDGKISSEFPDSEKLNMNIYSNNSLMDYGKLSEGTKETVSLAFRLAVMDHLFPDGGGVIVFDDPFTDMDAERMIQSCELIKECASRHQVIFLTCREEYIDLLGGNVIRM